MKAFYGFRFLPASARPNEVLFYVKAVDFYWISVTWLNQNQNKQTFDTLYTKFYPQDHKCDLMLEQRLISAILLCDNIELKYT